AEPERDPHPSAGGDRRLELDVARTATGQAADVVQQRVVVEEVAGLEAQVRRVHAQRGRIDRRDRQLTNYYVQHAVLQAGGGRVHSAAAVAKGQVAVRDGLQRLPVDLRRELSWLGDRPEYLPQVGVGQHRVATEAHLFDLGCFVHDVRETDGDVCCRFRQVRCRGDFQVHLDVEREAGLSVRLPDRVAGLCRP